MMMIAGKRDVTGIKTTRKRRNPSTITAEVSRKRKFVIVESFGLKMMAAIPVARKGKTSSGE